MLKKCVVRRLVAIVVAFSVVLMSNFMYNIKVMACEISDNASMIQEDEYAGGIVLYSGVVVGSDSVSNAPAHGGQLTLNIQTTTRAKTIKIIGNKNGGGANGSIWVRCNFPYIDRDNIPINGQWQTIYSSTVGVNGTLVFDYDLDAGGIYNIAIIAYD